MSEAELILKFDLNDSESRGKFYAILDAYKHAEFITEFINLMSMHLGSKDALYCDSVQLLKKYCI